MEEECKNGLMVATIQENGLMMLFKDTVNTPGVMEGSLMDNGLRTSFMERESSLGQMVEVTMVHMKMMPKVVSELMNGLMAKNLKVIGKMEIKTEKEFSQTPKVSLERVFGRMVKELTGLEK